MKQVETDKHYKKVLLEDPTVDIMSDFFGCGVVDRQHGTVFTGKGITRAVFTHHTYLCTLFGDSQNIATCWANKVFIQFLANDTQCFLDVTKIY